jgi:hypothetical protein
VFIRTAGPHSTGVHFVGRTDGILDTRQVALVRATARSFGVICNQFASGTPEDLPTPRIVVELDGTQTAVTVNLEASGGEPLEARATAGDAGEAVARAVLAATGSPLQFREARETPINGSRAVLVVYTDAKGMPKPGFLVSDEDLIEATAIASLRAIYGR